MSLSFPNPSRSYDSDRHRIRFWGHDSAMEVSFFLDEEVIFALFPKTAATEAAILQAFDVARERILAAAVRGYRPSDNRSSYTLTTSQF